MNAPPRMTRTVRGKRPQFYPEQALDLLQSMVMVLAQEHCVLRTQMNALQQILGQHGIPAAAELEKFAPTEDFLKADETWRQNFFQRLFYLLHQDAAEAKTSDTSARFEETLADIAKK